MISIIRSLYIYGPLSYLWRFALHIWTELGECQSNHYKLSREGDDQGHVPFESNLSFLGWHSLSSFYVPNMKCIAPSRIKKRWRDSDHAPFWRCLTYMLGLVATINQFTKFDVLLLGLN